jgi:hypothetical protein
MDSKTTINSQFFIFSSGLKFCYDFDFEKNITNIIF